MGVTEEESKETEVENRLEDGGNEESGELHFRIAKIFEKVWGV